MQLTMCRHRTISISVGEIVVLYGCDSHVESKVENLEPKYFFLGSDKTWEGMEIGDERLKRGIQEG
jgi:hypothetical protein